MPELSFGAVVQSEMLLWFRLFAVSKIESQSHEHEYISCVHSCKTWQTPQSSSMLKFIIILIPTDLFCVQRIAMQQKQPLEDVQKLNVLIFQACFWS